MKNKTIMLQKLKGQTIQLIAVAVLTTFTALYAAAQPVKMTRAQIRDGNKIITATPLNVGKPIITLDRLPGEVKRVGSLLCDSSGNCFVRNMPMIHQTHPLLENRNSLVYDGADIPNVGCYDASIVTLMVTALANRGKSLPPLVGRVKELEDIKAADGIPKEIRQLSWYYRIVKSVYEGKTPQKFYFPEIVANFNKGKIIESAFGQKCNPYNYGTADTCQEATNVFGNSFRYFEPQGALTAWTNKLVEQRMREGYVLLIAYTRYTPVKQLLKNGTTKIVFTNPSSHKVVFSGVQPGDYPLRINDVGNALRYNVRLSTDLTNAAAIKSLKLSDNNPVSEIVYPDGAVKEHKTFLEYDGVLDQVYFVDHIDGLRLSDK